MRIGIDLISGPGGIDGVVDLAVQAERDGFNSFWVPHISTRGYDALTILSLIGQRTSRIELGTAIIPTYPRHPVVMAQQALTAQAATKGRLALGLGPSHRPTIEDTFGLSYDKVARHIREYLSVLVPLVTGGRVDFEGEVYRVKAELQVRDAPPFPVLISALAPRMLQVAGELADGTITWMAGRKALQTQIVPGISAAAKTVRRHQPRICVGLPIAITDDISAGYQEAVKRHGNIGSMVNYRRVLDLEGVESGADIAVIGDEAQVERQLRAFAAAGATDLLASIFPVGPDEQASTKRTWRFLAGLVGKV